MKKILFLTNNEITKPFYEWLCAIEDNDVLLYSESFSLQQVKKINPDLIISYNYRHIIKEDVLNEFNKIINLHTSLLPYNRGANPNFWSFVEDTPKGVSIHLIDKGVDTGNILFQKEVFFDENIETLFSSYKMLHTEIQKLFIKNWDNLKINKLKSIKQVGFSTFHRQNQFEIIKSIIGENVYNIPIVELKRLFRKIPNDKNM